MTYPADHGPAAPDPPQYGPQYPQYGPQYPQEPQYGPQYPQTPPYAPQPYPYAAYPVAGQPGPPRKRNLIWIWIAAGVVAAVAVALLVVFLNRDKHPAEEKTAGRSLTAPASFDGYRLLSGYDTATLRRQLGSSLGSLGSSADKVAKDATIAVYAKPGVSRPQFVLLAFPVEDIPRFKDEVKDIGLDAAVKKFIGGIGTGIAGSSGSVSGKASPSIPDRAVARCGVSRSARQRPRSACAAGATGRTSR